MPNETINLIIAGCKVLANAVYTQRHIKVAKILHQQLGLKGGLLKKIMPNCRYLSTPVLENDRFKLYWDHIVLTDRQGSSQGHHDRHRRSTGPRYKLLAVKLRDSG